MPPYCRYPPTAAPLAVLAAAGQQHGRPHELGSALGEEQLAASAPAASGTPQDRRHGAAYDKTLTGFCDQQELLAGLRALVRVVRAEAS
ncbi:MAG TPA: hypothetical protein VFW16_09470 [Streptosporangiaceae bacterium]|nr:hypothetical protein [Streptosporangiaceae bacterium]